MSARTAGVPKLAVLTVLKSTVTLFFRYAPRLLPVAVVAAAILTAIEVTIAHELPSPWDGLLITLLDTAATVVVAGTAKELIRREHEGEPPPGVRELGRAVAPSLWPLTLVAVAQAVLVTIGLLLLIVPGLIVFARTLVAPAVVVAEKTTVREAFKRSNALVKGNTGRVFVLVFIATFFGPVAGELAVLVIDVLGVDDIDELAGAVIGEAVDLPVEGLLAPIVYYMLKEPQTSA